MEIANIEIGMEVVFAKDGLTYSVEDISKGWVALSGGKKARAKDLEQWETVDEDAELEEDIESDYEGEEPEEDDEEAASRMAEILNKHKPGYLPHLTPNGAKSQSNGDEVAELLNTMDVEQVLAFVEQKLGMDAGALVARYDHLNPGQKRMNAGNLLRGAVKRGELEL